MGVYKDRKNYKNHDFNTTTLTLDGEHKAEGLEMLEVELDEDETTVQKAGDGLAIFVNDPSKTGVIRMQLLEASATNKKLWELREAGNPFSVSILDKNAPDFNCRSAQTMVQKPPVARRSKEHDIVEWVLVSTYLDVKGDGYSLVSP